MQLDDLHALASLSMTVVGEQEGKTDGGQERRAMDDLLFFESTEGALNVFPGRLGMTTWTLTWSSGRVTTMCDLTARKELL